MKSANGKLQNKLQQLMGDLEKPPHNLGKVKDIHRQLASMVSDINGLKRVTK
ncbi:MAG: hypothetical protein GJ680_08240 [Alteromonadaceae bacterium]|nr:hypothetical protein [Alteromonadaceae bacterium]